MQAIISPFLPVRTNLSPQTDGNIKPLVGKLSVGVVLALRYIICYSQSTCLYWSFQQFKSRHIFFPQAKHSQDNKKWTVPIWPSYLHFYCFVFVDVTIAVAVIRRVRINSEKFVLLAASCRSLRLFVFLSARNNAAPTGRIFVKFYTGDFMKIFRNIHTSVKIWQQYWTLYMRT